MNSEVYCFIVFFSYRDFKKKFLFWNQICIYHVTSKLGLRKVIYVVMLLTCR